MVMSQISGIKVSTKKIFKSEIVLSSYMKLLLKRDVKLFRRQSEELLLKISIFYFISFDFFSGTLHSFFLWNRSEHPLLGNR